MVVVVVLAAMWSADDTGTQQHLVHCLRRRAGYPAGRYVRVSQHLESVHRVSSTAGGGSCMEATHHLHANPVRHWLDRSATKPRCIVSCLSCPSAHSGSLAYAPASATTKATSTPKCHTTIHRLPSRFVQVPAGVCPEYKVKKQGACLSATDTLDHRWAS